MGFSNNVSSMKILCNKSRSNLYQSKQLFIIIDVYYSVFIKPNDFILRFS